MTYHITAIEKKTNQKKTLIHVLPKSRKKFRTRYFETRLTHGHQKNQIWQGAEKTEENCA